EHDSLTLERAVLVRRFTDLVKTKLFQDIARTGIGEECARSEGRRPGRSRGVDDGSPGFGGNALAPMGFAEPIAEFRQLVGEEMQTHHADIVALMQDRPSELGFPARNLSHKMLAVLFRIGVWQARKH